jgi:hypothetical protein
LPSYTTSDIQSVTLFEDTASKSFSLDLFGVLESYRSEGAFVNYMFVGTLDSTNEISWASIDTGDYLTVNLVGGTSFQIDYNALA